MTEPSQPIPLGKSRRGISPRLRSKNLAIAIGIFALIILFYFVTIVKLQGLPEHLPAS